MAKVLSWSTSGRACFFEAVTMAAPTVPVVTHAINAHNCLLASGLYLADPAVAVNLHWATEATATVPSVSKNAANMDHSGKSPLSPPVDAAVLCAIVHIDHDNFWLTSDGGYHGLNTIWKEILDVKPSCTVLNPGFEPLNSDFTVTLEMLQVLTDKCITPGHSSSQSFFSCNNTGPTCFKL
ncbi:hypothetical protein EDC04DRAFT_2609160 [Pisolithus marmoratus]|nr:hypothetical protein EDC04DRAFT_2609160 [Pisolithus marmoratus]